MKKQAGQSLVEFAIGAAVMAVMLLGSITIAGYQQVQRQMAVAARQAAFQGSWNAAREAHPDSVRHAAESRLEGPALVNVAGNQYVPKSEITAAASMQADPGRASIAGDVMVQPLRVAGGFLGASFDLSRRGLFTGTITATIPGDRQLPEPFASMPVELTQSFSLLTDSWNASGPRQVRDRTAALVPTSVLSRLQAIWAPLLAPLSLIEPSLSRLCLGLIEPDRVPEDRLGSGRTPLPGRCP